jgi:hypothetical protein
MFFRLSSVELGLILLAIVIGATAVGLLLGRYLRHRSEHLREPVGVLQAALLRLVGLIVIPTLASARCLPFGADCRVQDAGNRW